MSNWGLEYRIGELVTAGCHARHVTNPLTAAIEALAHLGLSRVALISPYVRDVNEAVIDHFAESGVETVEFFSFEEDRELEVAGIPPESIRGAAIRAVKGNPRVDCVFVSCTNLHALDVVAEVERETGVACICSNLCLIWQAARLCGADLNREFRSALTDKKNL